MTADLREKKEMTTNIKDSHLSMLDFWFYGYFCCHMNENLYGLFSSTSLDESCDITKFWDIVHPQLVMLCENEMTTIKVLLAIG